MENVNNESVTQTETISDHSENQDANNDYKRDMFKFKEQVKAERDRTSALEARIKEFEHAEEAKKGNFSKVIEELKEKARSLENQNKQKDFNYAKTNIKSAIEKEALKHGCLDTDAFTSLIGDKYDIVSLDDGFTPSAEDIKMVVEDGMKRYEKINLFGKKVTIKDGVPKSGGSFDNNKKVDLSKMSWEDALAYAKTLDK